MQHLVPLDDVSIRFHFDADLMDEVTQNIERTVTENARTLGFEPFGFEEESG